MRVAVVGPVSPGDLLEFLSDEDGERARGLTGHGVPVGALVAALLRRGHEVDVVTHQRGHGQDRFVGPGLRIHRVSSRSSARRQIADRFREERRQMRDILAGLPLDVVHAHWTYEWALAALASDAGPTVITVHDAPVTVLRHNPDAYRLVRLLMASQVRRASGSALFTAVSPYLAAAWRRQMWDARDVDVIPNPVPVHLTDVVRASTPAVVEIADASRLKNVPTLLTAFALVRRSLPDATLELVGNGLDAGGDLARAAHRDGVADGVTFHGRLSPADVHAALARSRVHCHVSLEESFGMTLVEACRAGTPVVAGAGRGATGWVLGEGAGRLVDVRSPRAVSEALLSLLTDDSAWEAARARGSRVASRFDPDVVAEQYEEVYVRAIAASRRT